MASSLERVRVALPDAAREMARIGLRHVVDFQDTAYGARVSRPARRSSPRSTGSTAMAGYALTREGAKYLARAMAYDDVIRVADLKTRSSRLARVHEDGGRSRTTRR